MSEESKEEGEKPSVSHEGFRVFNRILEYAIGKKVVIKSHRESYTGTLISRDKRFQRLIVKDEKGNTHIIPVSARWTITILEEDAHE